MGRGVLVHAVLLALAASASIAVWTRDKKPAVSAGTVTVWNARPVDIERITFDAKGKKVSLESRKDGQGRWFFGTSEVPPKTVSFVSVGQAEKIAEALAPLKALREIGKVDGDRTAEFGMNEPDGTLAITISGKERKLTIGTRTPGGGDRYVREDGPNTVYVVKGDVTRDLESGDVSLGEREVHAFKDADIESLRILARGKSREILRRGPESKRIWADPSDPEKADETVSNWIAKVDRLKPIEYLSTEPTAPEQVVRLEYRAKGTQGGFLEIAKVQSATAKPDFVARSERTRLWAKIYAPVAEQVEQDLASVLR
jgi:hypothetical protein